jgi:hypothetical protein
MRRCASCSEEQFLRLLLPFSAVRARAYRRTVLTRGVLLTGPENRSVIFWCSKRTQETILDALAAARYHG